MNIRQHISNHLGRFFSVLLPGGTWHLREQLSRRIADTLAEMCEAKRVAIRVTPPQAKPTRDTTRGERLG
jgi:transposase